MTVLNLFLNSLYLYSWVTDASTGITVASILFFFPSEPVNFMCCRRKSGKSVSDVTSFTSHLYGQNYSLNHISFKNTKPPNSCPYFIF